MKRIATTMALALTVIAGAFAQSAQIKIKAKEGEIPAAVIKSFKKDFIGVAGEEWAIVPTSMIGDEYIISKYNDLNGEKPTSYVVTMKGTNMKSEAIYDQNGKLKYSKEIIKETVLPTAVRNAVLKKYPGFALLKDQEIIKEGKSNFIHYRVIIEKGKEKMALAVDNSGQILKEKKIKV